jgi:hypothetical protein
MSEAWSSQSDPSPERPATRSAAEAVGRRGPLSGVGVRLVFVADWLAATRPKRSAREGATCRLGRDM